MRAAWTQDQAKLPEAAWLAASDFIVQTDQIEMRRQVQAIEMHPVSLSDAEVSDLVSFMHALTAASVNAPLFGVPDWFKP